MTQIENKARSQGHRVKIHTDGIIIDKGPKIPLDKLSTISEPFIPASRSPVSHQGAPPGNLTSELPSSQEIHPGAAAEAQSDHRATTATSCGTSDFQVSRSCHQEPHIEPHPGGSCTTPPTPIDKATTKRDNKDSRDTASHCPKREKSKTKQRHHKPRSQHKTLVSCCRQNKSRQSTSNWNQPPSSPPSTLQPAPLGHALPSVPSSPPPIGPLSLWPTPGRPPFHPYFLIPNLQYPPPNLNQQGSHTPQITHSCQQN